MTAPDPIDLKCQEAVEQVSDYLAQALEPEERVRFEQHLLTCPPCTIYLGQMKTTIELARGLAVGADADGTDLAELIRRWKQT